MHPYLLIFFVRSLSMFLFRTLGRLVGIATLTSSAALAESRVPSLVSSSSSATSTMNSSSSAAPGPHEIAYIAGGCFWCIEAVYNEMEAVIKAESGYMGGSTKNPTYEQVCDGDTGHAEAVQITYDPKRLTYKEILDIFFTIHDPTQLNRQGNDVGTQYRSTIFYANDEQKTAAQTYLNQLTQSGTYKRPIVTTLEPVSVWYPAEAYHQRYFQRNPTQPYVAHVVTPKVHKARDKFNEKLKSNIRD